MTADLHPPALPPTAVPAGSWLVRDGQTVVRFSVRGGTGTAVGAITVSAGGVEVGRDGIPLRAWAQLDLRTVDTGIARRDADLRGPRFLDSERHPQMTWSADRFTADGAGDWTADGVLALRGTSTTLPLRAVPEFSDADGGRLRLRGTARLDRRAVGIRAPAVLIGRFVGIEIDAELILGPASDAE